MYDFHTHTFFSDGELGPIELIRRALVNGYKAIAVTDHVGIYDQERILPVLVRECEVASREMGIVAIPGVELTHVPPHLIDQAARKAKDLGAQIVIVHGETITEPVAPGTNRAALLSRSVDILAHPGFLSEEDAALAKERGVYVELSGRRGHSLTNGHVARLAIAAGAATLVNSDAHVPGDLLTPLLAAAVARGAGLSDEQALQTLQTNPLALLRKLERLFPST
ncbi:MAG: histidinol phosphate phosphatase domain-containing protein [Dehalococcoidia bacterium]|nr:histidinol phosphate phosphatase domain-containing protein [Dehalococcoidia bacterium]